MGKPETEKAAKVIPKKEELKVKCPDCGSEDVDNMDVIDSDGECVDREVVETIECSCGCIFDVKFKTVVLEIIRTS